MFENFNHDVVITLGLYYSPDGQWRFNLGSQKMFVKRFHRILAVAEVVIV